MVDIFEVYDNIEDVLSLLTDWSKEMAVARLREWLRETELEINQFEATQWEQHLEEVANMRLSEFGGMKDG